MMRFVLRVAGMCAVLFGLAGCGSSGGSSPKQEKTALITFSVYSGSHSAPLNSLQLSAKLPAGLSVTNITTALTPHNSTGQLVGGTYDASTRTLSFGVLSPTVPISFYNAADGTNSLAVLKCDVTPGVTLSQLDFDALNTPFPLLEMFSGTYNGNSVDLSNEMKNLVKLTVTFGY